MVSLEPGMAAHGAARALGPEAGSLPIPPFEDPKAYAWSVVRKSGSSFLLPMLLLARPRRQAMLALYAFCRETDDVADEVVDKAMAGTLIEAWREEIQALYRGRPRHPVTLALAEPVERYGLAEKYFLGILDGFDLDRSGAMLRPSMATLERYCYNVACCVGLLSVEIFGYRSPRIPEFAEHLGHAFQLTNILRDVAEDARLGRIYLPGELLAKHGLADIEPDALIRSPATPKVCAEIGQMARERFHLAAEILPDSERASMRPALLMRAVYERYLDRIEAAGFRVDGPPISFSKLQKITLVLGGLLGG
jgi:phytoene synthase